MTGTAERRALTSVSSLLAAAALALHPPAASARTRTLVPRGAVVRYRKGLEEPPAGWREPGFDDSSWLAGPMGLGYGDHDDATVLTDMQGAYSTVYARAVFDVTDPLDFLGLTLRMSWDDGFVAWLNGTEIARRGVTGDPVPHDAGSEEHEAAGFEAFDATPFLRALRPGRNVLCLQGVNRTADSSDFSLHAVLTAGDFVPAVRGPWLGPATTTSVTIVFDTALPTRAAVEHGPTPALGQATDEPGPPRRHHVLSADLGSPGARGWYRVLADEVPVSDVLPLHANAGPDAPGFRMDVIGDGGDGGPEQAAVIATVLADEPDLVLYAGDLCYDSGARDEWEPHYFGPMADVLATRTVWPVPGDHDVLRDGGAAWADVLETPRDADPSGRYHAFTYGNVRILTLDTTQDLGPRSAERRFLEDQLARPRPCWTLVLTHHPPYTSSAHADDPGVLAVRRALVPLLESSGVDLVLSGHDHDYERSFPVAGGRVVSSEQDPDYVDPGAPVYVVTGGGGRESYPAGTRWHTAFSESTHEHVRIDVAGATLSLAMVDASGVVRDAMTLRKTTCGCGAAADPAPGLPPPCGSPCRLLESCP